MGEPIEELGGLTWDDLEVKEHASGRLLFKDELRRRQPDGTVKVTPCRIWAPTPADHFQARAEATAWFGEPELRLDRDRDAGTYDYMEQLCLLARSIRTAEEPHAQLYAAKELARFDEGLIRDIQERVEVYRNLTDPRDPKITDERFWRVTAAVARRASLDPLRDIAGHAQPSFVVRMAKEALRSPTGQSWLQSSASSTPAPSPSPSSAPS